MAILISENRAGIVAGSIASRTFARIMPQSPDTFSHLFSAGPVMDTEAKHPVVIVELNEEERRHIFAEAEVERYAGEYGVWRKLWERIKPQLA